MDDDEYEEEGTVMITVAETGIPIGTKVGVFAPRTTPDAPVYFLGYAIYEGDYPMDDSTSQKCYQSKDAKLDLFQSTGKVPTARLRMEDGTVLWGTQVRWAELDLAEKLLTDESVEVKSLDPKVFMEDLRSFTSSKDDFLRTLDKCNVLVYPVGIN